MKAALYIRVSTEMQAEDGFSVEGQKARLFNFAQSQDWEIYDFYIDDGYSAKDLNRPDMQRLLADMEEQKFDVVLVYKLDRLTRSVADLHKLLKTFDQYGVKFKSSTEIFETTTAMGRFFITLVGAMAEWERETISERVRFGVEQMVVEGKRPGGVYPYGYTSEGKLIPEEKELIREVRGLYMSGMGYKSIAMKMNREGKLRRGSEWTAATVAYTIENPFYAGIIRLGSKTNKGTYANTKRDERVKCIYGEGDHEAVFTREEYEETKKFMERKTHGGYSRIKTYWFSGVLRCGRCGAAMFGKLTTKRMAGGETVRTPYYICANRHANSSCDMPIFRQVHIEHLMMEYIMSIRADSQLLAKESSALLKDQAKKTSEVDDAKRELARIVERKEKWQYMFVEGLISKEEVRKRITEEDEKEKEAKKKIAANEVSLSAIPKLEELAEMEELWPLIDDEEKKMVVFTLFKKITINTPLTNPKGVKNKFFEARIDEVLFN
ncbi:recombinase family protein [Paenibacillus sp. DMB20]|uniref:recombinase family protein n=1 Tax=Paenibacillus sp. DMB20 TaxID=1642570 RepID=UPI00069A474E|nr:recombinase family protein [Paenibacillus sp. DMB20]